MKGSTKTVENSQFCRGCCVDCDLPKTVLYQAELHSDHVVPTAVATGRVLIALMSDVGKRSQPKWLLKLAGNLVNPFDAEIDHVDQGALGLAVGEGAQAVAGHGAVMAGPFNAVVEGVIAMQ